MSLQWTTFHRAFIFIVISASSSTACVPTTLWIDDLDETNSNVGSDSAIDTGPPNPTPSSCDPALPGPIDLVTPVGDNEYAHFQLESVDWALGLIHANHQLTALSENQGGPTLSPSWFLAMALNATDMDCSQPGGCYSFSESNHWSLLCELYEELDCHSSSMNDVLGIADKGDGNAGAATMAFAWHAALSFALLPHGGFEDPNAWFAQAADAQALEKIMVLSTIDSPWSTTLQAVANNCQNQLIENCIDDERTWLRNQVVAVAAHTIELEDAVANDHCAQLQMNESDIREYGVQLARLFPLLEWESATEVAASTFEEPGDLMEHANTIVHQLDESSGLQLSCPQERLDTLYDTECPE